MKNITISSFVLLTIAIFSCTKHEVIPAPEPKVDLKAGFTGNVNGADTEYTKNVLGYYGVANETKIILPSPELSSAVYYYEMKSAEQESSIKVGLGSVVWDAASSSDPSLTTFNNFFKANTSPVYSDDGVSGFTVVYKDGQGNQWYSSEASVNTQSVSFSNVKQESDASGDYSKFICNFSCYVYRTHGNPAALDSLAITNGQLKGWFQR